MTKEEDELKKAIQESLRSSSQSSATADNTGDTSNSAESSADADSSAFVTANGSVLDTTSAANDSSVVEVGNSSQSRTNGTINLATEDDEEDEFDSMIQTSGLAERTKYYSSVDSGSDESSQDDDGSDGNDETYEMPRGRGGRRGFDVGRDLLPDSSEEDEAEMSRFVSTLMDDSPTSSRNPFTATSSGRGGRGGRSGGGASRANGKNRTPSPVEYKTHRTRRSKDFVEADDLFKVNFHH